MGNLLGNHDHSDGDDDDYDDDDYDDEVDADDKKIPRFGEASLQLLHLL